jgi:dihydrofolate reductase
MRKVVVSTIVSLDGYHEGPGKDVLAVPFDDGFSKYNVERLRRADALLLGRKSYEGFLSYWPSVVDDVAAPDVEREISRRNTAIEKVVVSDTLQLEQTSPWDSTTRIVPRAQASAAVEQLKAGTGRDILIFGSRTMWNSLLLAGLVDELHVMVGPALLGDGTSIYGGSSRVPLRLMEARVLESSQLVLLRYDARPSEQSVTPAHEPR